MKLTLDILRRAKVAINLPELNILDGLKIPFRPGESDLHHWACRFSWECGHTGGVITGLSLRSNLAGRHLADK